jgi:salicylate hydroxylase
MAPSAAQGGAQAIEDAWILTDALSTHSSGPSDALRLYERRRRDRIGRVARAAEANLAIFGLIGVSASARDALLRVLPASVLLPRLDWLFGWKPP